MKIVPGTLYFISEVDVLTGQTFDYYKIGLVKDSRQGDSFDRAGEHQTGNPRRLTVKHTVETPAINDLETLMHDLYATSRIFGEWFVLPGETITEAVQRAQALANEQQDLVEATTRVGEFAVCTSDGEVVPATPEATALAFELHQARFEQKEIKKVHDVVKGFLEGLTSSTFDATLFLTWTTRRTPKFDEAALKAAHPELYQHYVSEETKLSGTFTPATPRDLNLSLPDPLRESLDLQRIRVDTAGQHPSEEQVREIHFHYLQHLALLGDAGWREDRAATTIKTLIGDHLGIDQVAKWTRSMKTAEKFDAGTFKQEHPDVAAAFTTVTENRVPSVADMRSYAIAR
jgi:hypothetical protein